MSDDVPGPRFHDYPLLISRWQALARTLGLAAQAYATVDAYELFYVGSLALKPIGGL